MDATLAPHVADFLVHARATLAATYGETDAKCRRTTVLELDAGGVNYARLVREERGEDGALVGRSAMGFIALTATDTRTLGHVSAGDLLKCDGWKKPARGVRGSVLRPETWVRFSGYGGVA